jgi:ornithine cyclodeaminase/alanine dehydrogenase-like protein (mu-crystallin family)
MTLKVSDYFDEYDLVTDVFRLSGEPFSYIKEMDVHQALTKDPQAYYQFIKKRLTNIALNKAELQMPAKLLFSDQDSDGDFRVMPCVVKDGNEVMKTVKLVGTNVIQQDVPDQITVGKACVFHPTENFITHIVEACLLSSARTAICAMLGVDFLANSRKKMTIIGAGRVGYYAAFYAASLGWADEVIIHDIDIIRAEKCVASLQSEFANILFQVSDRDALTDTDVLILCTTSATPIYSNDDFKADLIVSVGADIDTQRELDNSWAQTASLFVDSYDSARYGDIKAWTEDNLIDKNNLTDLFSLITGFELIDDQRPRIFVSTGTAFFDNLTLSYLLKMVEQ